MANPAQQAALAKLAASFGSLAKSLPPAPKPAPVISGSVNAGGGGGRPVPQTSVRVPWSIAPPKPAAPPAFHPIQRLGTTIAGAPQPGGSRSPYIAPKVLTPTWATAYKPPAVLPGNKQSGGMPRLVNPYTGEIHPAAPSFQDLITKVAPIKQVTLPSARTPLAPQKAFLIGGPPPVRFVDETGASKADLLRARIPDYWFTAAGQKQMDAVRTQLARFPTEPVPAKFKAPQAVIDYIKATPATISDPIQAALNWSAGAITKAGTAAANWAFQNPPKYIRVKGEDGRMAMIRNPMAAGLGGDINAGLKNVANQLTTGAAEALPSMYELGKAGAAATFTGDTSQLSSMAKQLEQAWTTGEGWKKNWLLNLLALRGAVISVGDLAALSRVGAEEGATGALASARNARAALASRILPEAPNLARAPYKLMEGVDIPRTQYAKSLWRRTEQKVMEKAFPPLGAHEMQVLPSRLESPVGSGEGGYYRRVNRYMNWVHGMALRVTAHQRAEIQAWHIKNLTDNLGDGSGVRAINPLTGETHNILNGHEAVNPIIQGMLSQKNLGADLDTIIARLHQERQDIVKAEPNGRAHNRIDAAISQFEGLRHNDQFMKNPGAVFDAAHRAAERLNKQQPGLIRRGIVNTLAADRSKLLPFIYEHMGGRLAPTDKALQFERESQKLADMKSGKHPASDFQLRDQKALVKSLKPHKGDLGFVHPSLMPGHGVDPEKAVINPDAGKLITNEQAMRAMEAHGINPDHIAYVTHRPLGDEQARYMGVGRLAKGSTKRRTMASYEQGQPDFRYDAVVNQEHRGNFLLRRHDQRIDILNQIMVRKSPDEPLYNTAAEANRANTVALKDQHGIPRGVDLQVVRVPEYFTGKERLAAINRDLSGPSPDTHTSMEQTYQDGGSTRNPFQDMADQGAKDLTDHPNRNGQYALVLAPAIKRLAALEGEGTTDWERFLGQVSQAFRQTVLPLTPKRLWGVPFEVGGRLLVNRAGWKSYRFAQRQLDAMAHLESLPEGKIMSNDPKTTLARRDMLDMQLARMRETMGSGTVTGQVLNQRRFQPGGRYGTPWMNTLQRRAQIARNFTGVHQVLDAYIKSTNWIMRTLINPSERLGTKIAWGRAAAEHYAADLGKPLKEVMKWDAKAHRDYIEGMVNTPAQHAFALTMERAMGQWMAQGPGMLRALRYVPFLSWTVNAYKFIYATMPQDHPILTGLFAAANTASAQQRAAVGLSGPFAGNPNEVELAQESGIPLPGGKIFSSAGHYFPGSAVGDPFSAVGDVLPPFQPLLDASLGVQFTGEFPKNAQGKRVRPDAWTMAQMALGGMLDSIAGPYRIIKQFATKPPSAGREFFGIEPRFAQTPPPKSSAGGYSTGGYSTGGYSTGSYSTGGYP